MKFKALKSCRWGLNSLRYVLTEGEFIEIDNSLKSHAIASGLFEVVEDKAVKNGVQKEKKEVI